jgi:hypothetical protein
VFKSLEDYMHERQHYLNESSSARLGGFCRAQIVSRRIAWAAIFLMSAVIFIRRRDFNVHLVSSVYYVVPHSFGAYNLNRRIYFEKAHIFWKSANILERRQYFGKVPIF